MHVRYAGVVRGSNVITRVALMKYEITQGKNKSKGQVVEPEEFQEALNEFVKGDSLDDVSWEFFKDNGEPFRYN